MDNDDLPVGELLTRRQVLALLGGTSALLVVGGVAPGRARALPQGACVVRPALTEGPYFVDELLNRSDIRSDPSDSSVRPGLPLEMTFNITGVSGDSCMPLQGLYVDVWHCDHLGVYSDASDPSFNTVGRKFLRGYQITDANGQASFTTIYPGWYSSRAVHIHFKIRSGLTANPGFEFTSQLFFDDAYTDAVYTRAPYSTRGARATRNANDGIYSSGGSQLVLAPTETDTGYAATFDIALTGIDVPVERSTWGGVKRSLGF